MIFAVGTNVLGYGNKRVNNAILKVVKNGNLSTLNTYDEVNLASELLKINKWADMVKFARTGGEANTIAIRIARAASNFKKQNIAVCGYHGWHDWYLASNIKNKKNLNYHLANNVRTAGVNPTLKDSIFLFKYNDLERLEYLLKEKKIGIVKMEVERNIKPKNNFLKSVRKLTLKYKAILIFDECTSGFRETYGGLHTKYGIKPDMITYGKALGNGYAITAVLGKKKIMQAAQDTFLSSTFWSERIGFAAGLETLKVMKEKKTWISIRNNGQYIMDGWNRIAKKNNLDIEIYGLKSIPQFKFLKNNNLLKTFITSEMLKRKYLASNVVYVSISHSKKIIDKYLKDLDEVLYKISKMKNPVKEIKIEEAHQDFKRLN
jgi:glutamate-1-semialdehyde aminotransferase